MSNSKKIKIIITIVAISFLQGLQFCVSPVLSSIQKHYPTVDVSLIQMLITAPSILAMVMALVSGGLVVKISKKKLLILAGLISGVTGFLPFLSDSFALLFASRTMYGIGLGIATALNTAVVAEFFEGKERVTVMGIQAAAVGTGMVIVNMVGGILGKADFRQANWINIIGFISMGVIAFCLPETGVVKTGKTEKLHMTAGVFRVCILGGFEFLFLITFSTNIAMHISGALAGNSSVSGALAGIFSGAQIVVGILIGMITKVTKKYTLHTAMGAFCVGGILLILFPSNLVMLMLGALFCGFSQGMFMPTAMVEVANAVDSSATAMAAACLTCGNNLTQIVSPYILNTLSKILFHEVTTTHVYQIAVAGMAIVVAAALIADKKNKNLLTK